MGLWYEINNTRGIGFQPDFLDCVTAEYTGLDLPSGTFRIYNSSQWRQTPRFGGTLFASIKDNPNGQASVKGGRRFGQYGDPNYLILDTDYDSYSMVYSCGNNNPILWILSRTPELDDSVVN